MRSTMILELLGLVAVFGSVAQAVVIHCPAGFFPNGAGNCVPCGAGQFSTTTAFNTLHGPFSCTPCAAGTFQPATGKASCTPCPAGTANTHTGSTSSAACVACPPGSVAPAGSSTCSVCGSGTQANGGACMDCPAGTFNAVSGGTCCECCSGFWSHPKSSSCMTCPGNKPFSLPGSTNAGDCGTTSLAPAHPRALSCTQTGTTCPAVNGPAGSMRRKRSDSFVCAPGYMRCAHVTGQGGFDCVDVANDVESCGGCVSFDDNSNDKSGEDCTAIFGVSVTMCKRGRCHIKSCRHGFVRSTDGRACIPVSEFFHHNEERDESVPAAL